MTRREDYLGCRVSERGNTDSNTLFSGLRIPYRDNKYRLEPNNNLLTTDPLSDFERDVYDLFLVARSLLISKHHDYGPTNIANAPGGALNGLRVRIHDKTARINNLIDSGKNAQHESLRDSFLDLMNYAAIALLVIDGNWPGVEPDDTEADCG